MAKIGCTASITRLSSRSTCRPATFLARDRELWRTIIASPVKRLVLWYLPVPRRSGTADSQASTGRTPAPLGYEATSHRARTPRPKNVEKDQPRSGESITEPSDRGKEFWGLHPARAAV